MAGESPPQEAEFPVRDNEFPVGVKRLSPLDVDDVRHHVVVWLTSV
ncbi:hypothetical protein [Amycolatopsis taiwanensis]|nr:hypothetical protein [Amycolatopsis taiwanensis]